eukprot:s39_g46.t1
MDNRAAMTYHLGNALLHLQYLAGHMLWFVPPADIAPAPASFHAGPGHNLTTFVPHPGRPSNPASSSRPITDYAISTRTFDDRPGVLITNTQDPWAGPPFTRDPASSSPNPPGPAPPAASRASSAPPTSETHCPIVVDRQPPRGLSISRSPPMPPPHHPPLATSTSPPPTGDSGSHGTATTPSNPRDTSAAAPPATHPTRPSSPVMAPERRHKRRRVVSTRADPGPSDDMPPPAPPAPESSIPPSESSNPADSSIVHISGHVLPITDSPPRAPGETGDAPDSDSDDSHLSTHPPSGEGTPATAPAGPTIPPRDLFRNWAPVDDHELISYKKDTKARPSWKTIGQRLHRSAESCRARWLWLQSTGLDQIVLLRNSCWPICILIFQFGLFESQCFRCRAKKDLTVC